MPGFFGGEWGLGVQSRGGTWDTWILCCAGLQVQMPGFSSALGGEQRGLWGLEQG